MFLVLLVYALRSGKLRLAEEPSEFKVLENDVEGYLAHRKETNERNLIEKEKITELEQDLEKVKVEIEKEINEAKHDAPLNQ